MKSSGPVRQHTKEGLRAINKVGVKCIENQWFSIHFRDIPKQCMYLCMYVYMYVGSRVGYVGMYVYICIYEYVCMYVCVCIEMLQNRNHTPFFFQNLGPVHFFLKKRNGASGLRHEIRGVSVDGVCMIVAMLVCICL